ncbi:MAG: hypothetical protein KDC98_08885 [Planctomycetes bacterium]|nr:hypothetical protein [Planctomycetota bacterium]
MTDQQDVPPHILQCLATWDRMATQLQWTHVTLGLLATILSLTVAAFASFLTPIWITVFSFLASVSLALLTSFRVGQKAGDLRAGWRHLSVALMRFRSQPDYTVADLITAYGEAETMLGDVQYSPSKGADPA